MHILVIHDQPKDFKNWLETAIPQHPISWATKPSEIPVMLNRFQPQVVFSIKHSEYPGEFHRMALEHPAVKWFHVGGSGTDHLGSWDPDRVLVTNSAGCLAPFHAERAMAALLYLTTGLNRLTDQQRNRDWNPTRFSTLQGQTMLIVGMGKTGQELGRRARAFGMRVLAVKQSWETRQTASDFWDVGCPTSELANLWSQADVLSLNVPLNPQTHHMVGAEQLAALPSHAYVLNGSRGSVVNNKALVNALSEGRLSGVWLDVTEPEPLPEDSPLWSHPKVLITPHCADQVHDFPLRFARLFTQNLALYERGETMINRVECGA